MRPARMRRIARPLLPATVALSLLLAACSAGPGGSDGPIAHPRCGVVSGQEATDWYQALTGANQLTRFVKDDHRYQVMVRFMLPDEPLECPALAA